MAIELVRRWQSSVQDAERGRLDAIEKAAEAGCALRDIAEATGGSLSYEWVRRAVGDRADVAFEWRRELFQVSEPQVRALAYKADGFGRNAFPGDVQLLGAGDGWLPVCKQLAWEIQKRHAGTIDDPLVLDDHMGYALGQILRLTYMSRPSRLADLADQLFADLGLIPGSPMLRDRSMPTRPRKPRR